MPGSGQLGSNSPVKFSIQLGAPPAKVVASNTSSSTVPASCDCCTCSQELLSAVAQPGPGFMRHCNDRSPSSGRVLGDLLLLRFPGGVPIHARCCRHVPRSSWVPHCDVKQGVWQLSQTIAPHIKPGFRFNCEFRDKDFTTSNCPNLLEDLCIQVCKPVVSASTKRTSLTASSVVALRVKHCTTQLTRRVLVHTC